MFEFEIHCQQMPQTNFGFVCSYFLFFFCVVEKKRKVSKWIKRQWKSFNQKTLPLPLLLLLPSLSSKPKSSGQFEISENKWTKKKEESIKKEQLFDRAKSELFLSKISLVVKGAKRKQNKIKHYCLNLFDQKIKKTSRRKLNKH